MKKSTIIGISILSVLLLLSISIIPSAQSSMVKEEIEEKFISSLNARFGEVKIEQILNNIQSSIINKLIGIFYIIAGLISLYFTVMMVLMGFVAITFNPTGFILFIFAFFLAILTIIFLSGGFNLLISDDPSSNFITIMILSFTLFIVWVVFRLNNVSFVYFISILIGRIIHFLESIFDI
jgi:hypothetical protein